MKSRKSVFWLIGLVSMAAVLLAFTPAVRAQDVTDQQIAAAITGGQKYLFDSFIDQGAGYGGYWDMGSNDFAATSAAVAALIETGKYNDPAYAAVIDKGVKYLLSVAMASGSFNLDAMGNEPYNAGLSLVALSSYGKAATLGAADTDALRAAIQSGYDYLKALQNTDGSWPYGDLSNTQFGTMGMFYASRYLGLPIKGSDWATKLLSYLDLNQHDTQGYFAYYDASYSTDFITTMTGAGLWCLAMIEEGQLGFLPDGVTKTRAQRAIDWLDAHYNTATTSGGGVLVNGWNNDEYYIFAMAKGLTGILGTQGLVGTHNWVQDLKNAMWGYIELGQGVDSLPVPNPTPPATTPTPCHWTETYWTSSPNLGTSWVLMALAFANPSTESPTKFLPVDPITTDVPVVNQGLVTLETSGGVTISQARRGNIHQATKKAEVTLPIGAFDFTLNNVPNGGTTVLTLIPPAGALDPTNPDGFLNADGTIKDGLSWFKIQGGEWKGVSSIPIEIDLLSGEIKVTLRDGGPEDDDGVANGKIVDPGAPGVGAAPVAAAPHYNDSHCFIATAAYGSPMAADVVALRLFRDRYLLTNPLGKAFVAAYYAVSPPIARVIARHEPLRVITRIALTPVVAGVKHPGASLGLLLFGSLLFTGIAVYRRKERD